MNDLTIEDKRRIVARIFFTDNRDQYEDYHEALSEFISGNNQSEDFINFAVKPYVESKKGHTVLMRDDGHVVDIRESDGFLSYRTDMTEDEAESLQDQTTEVIDEYPDKEPGIWILKSLGWRVIA